MTRLVLKRGDFIRVKADHPEASGLDGMVLEQFDDGSVGLMFGRDRFDQPQGTSRIGFPELWSLDELDLTSLES